MKKIKTAEATELQLDWLVDQCLHKYKAYRLVREALGDSVAPYKVWIESTQWSPTTNWAQGGPIIEANSLTIEPHYSEKWTSNGYYGSTPLIAAMRCYVASKLGDEVEVPDELAA